MKFRIEELTQPLTADVLNRRDFTFASGGSGGGTSTPVIAVHQPIVSRKQGSRSMTIGAGTTLLSSTNIIFKGGRRFSGKADILIEQFDGVGYINVDLAFAVTLDGSLPGGDMLGYTAYKNPAMLFSNGVPTTAVLPYFFSFGVPYYNTALTLTPAGAHTLDLWVINASELRTNPLPNPPDGPGVISMITSNLDAMEFDAV